MCTPVQSFAAETYFILIVITKGPQLVLETNILLLILGWRRLCTNILTAYTCVCVATSLFIYNIAFFWSTTAHSSGVSVGMALMMKMTFVLANNYV